MKYVLILSLFLTSCFINEIKYPTPKFSVGECVEIFDSFGDSNGYLSAVAKINKTDYKLAVYSRSSKTWFMYQTHGIRYINENYRKTDCP